MKQIYLEVNQEDEIILIDKSTKKAKFSISTPNNIPTIKNIAHDYKQYYSIEEFNLNDLLCLSSLENFINNSFNINLPKKMLSNINNVYELLNNKINKSKNANSKNIINTKYYKITHYKFTRSKQSN